MGTQPGADQDAWLRAGGVVVASTDRAVRAVQAEFHRRRRAEGATAWPAPQIFDWKTFARNAWEEHNRDGRLLLNPVQEQAIWSEIIHSEQHLPTALPASIRRLASMAMEAHDLLCSYAPQYLRNSARAAWDNDAGAFSQWLADFDIYCRDNNLLTQSRLPLELIPILQSNSATHPPLRLAGFDRLLPAQRNLFDAWGTWEQFTVADSLAQPRFHSVRDTRAELEACAFWCDRKLAANPDTRLLVIAQNLSQHRGEIERAFLRYGDPGTTPRFEFSLGVPLHQILLVRSALLLARWLGASLEEGELDWLFASGFAAAADESAALQSAMRTLRRRDLQRTHWPLEGFLNQSSIAEALPPAWKRGIIAAQRSLKESPSFQTHLEWADKIPYLLETAGWRGVHLQASVDFQAHRRWQHALDLTGSLGFDGRRVPWQDFLAELESTAADILFAPESTDAPIQIAGPAESAGLSADAIWFLGADEDAWPAVGSMHPFLPPSVQRESSMPHASHLQDWQFSSTITARLLASAPEVHFSFAQQANDVEARPSRLITQLVGNPQSLPSDFVPSPYEDPVTERFTDSPLVPYSFHHLRGGAYTLSSQSQCPFKAFATARLSADTWDPAESGLSAKQRGLLLHAVLHSIWSGTSPGIKTHADLSRITDPPTFVSNHVKSAMNSDLPPGVREQMPPLYLELEEMRLIRLVTEWLQFESVRLPFTVEETEAKRVVNISGLSMNLRLDRVDRLHDGSLLVIDYKTGAVSPAAWDLPRPEDVQLPLYKLFALPDSSPTSGGLVFAKVRSGDVCFAGRVADAKTTIKSSLSGTSSLVRRKLTSAVESEWKAYIEQLARDFIAGRTDVDPRDYPQTCERCGLQSICRIQESENRARLEGKEETEGENAAEE